MHNSWHYKFFYKLWILMGTLSIHFVLYHVLYFWWMPKFTITNTANYEEYTIELLPPKPPKPKFTKLTKKPKKNLKKTQNSVPDKSQKSIFSKLSSFYPSKIFNNFMGKTTSSIKKKDANKILQNQKKHSTNMARKSQKLKSLYRWQSFFVSTKGQDEVLDLLGRDYKKQEFVPKGKIPPGEFDWNDFTIYNLDKIKKGYFIIFVDRQGRVKRKIFTGKDAQLFHSLHKAFQLGRNSQLFAKVLQYTLKTIPKYLNK